MRALSAQDEAARQQERVLPGSIRRSLKGKPCLDASAAKPCSGGSLIGRGVRFMG